MFVTRKKYDTKRNILHVSLSTLFHIAAVPKEIYEADEHFAKLMNKWGQFSGYSVVHFIEWFPFGILPNVQSMDLDPSGPLTSLEFFLIFHLFENNTKIWE